MRSKFLIALTLLLLGSSVAYSDIIKSTITIASFAKAPVAVVDPTKDSLFADANAESLFFSAGKSNHTLYAWSINWDITSNSSTALIRKSLDASTLAEKDSAISIKASIKSKIGIVGQPGIGYVGFAALRDSGKDTADNFYFNVLAADADEKTLPTEVQITDNSVKTDSYYLVNVWWQDDYFYVLFIQVETSKGYEKGLYLQAIKGSDASLLWKSAVEVVSLNNPPSTTIPIAGANKASGADAILVSWKEYDTKALKQTTVSISNGKVDDPTILVSDTDSVIYFPDGVISASNVYGIVIDRQTKQDQSISDSLRVYYNGATSKPSTLDLTAPNNYNSPIIRAFDNSIGFAVVSQWSGENDDEYSLRTFDKEGNAHGDQMTLAKTVGNIILFTDASGAIWLGYADFNSTDGKVSTGYLGEVLAF
jgi:hypothetical protein